MSTAKTKTKWLYRPGLKLSPQIHVDVCSDDHRVAVLHMATPLLHALTLKCLTGEMVVYTHCGALFPECTMNMD